MYEFEKREDGLFATHPESGRAVAHIQTKRLGETNDPKLKVQERTEETIPPAEWRIHFTGFRFTPASLKAFLSELEGAEG